MSPEAVTYVSKMKGRQYLETDVWTLACERMRVIFERFDHVMVSFSGGKDSTATLQVALHVAHEEYPDRLPLRVIFYDEEVIAQETEDYVRRIAARDDVDLEWYCLPVRHRNAASRTSPYWWPWAPEVRDKWARPMPPEAITTLEGFPTEPPMARLTIPNANGLLAPPELGNAALVMGIRAQESPTRQRAVRVQDAGEEFNYLKHLKAGGDVSTTSRGNIWKAYPIYDWTTEDVWTAPAKFGWDYNKVYDLLEMRGMGHASQRCSPAFGEEPLQQVGLWAECCPDVWEKACERVPGVGAAWRYARTELYGFGSKPEKPPGMPWGDFVLHYAAQFGPKVQRLIANRIRTEIRNHYRQVSDPVAKKASHPDTGLSWNFLLMLGMRGDLKNRRQPKTLIVASREDPARLWRKYADDIQASLDDGTFAELGYPGRPPESGWSLIPDVYREAAAAAT